MLDLTTIYKRAMQYCVAKFGQEPDELHLLEDGSFNVIFSTICCGEYSEESEQFDESCLTQDLDTVYEERKRIEDEIAEKIRLEHIELNKRRVEREKDQRKQQYLKLKKEFE